MERNARKTLRLPDKIVGAAPIIGAVMHSQKGKYISWSLGVSQFTCLGLIFAEAFLIVKFAFKKSNQEAAKIGGIATGVAFAALVLFVVADYFIRDRVLKTKYPADDAIGDILLLEAAATCFIPTILGAIQVAVIDACKNSQLPSMK